MMDKRRTIAFKLNPDVNQTDKIVCDTLDSIPQGERSRLNRAALTAGLALYRQDPGAPFLLCELLTKETIFRYREYIEIAISKRDGRFKFFNNHSVLFTIGAKK